MKLNTSDMSKPWYRDRYKLFVIGSFVTWVLASVVWLYLWPTSFDRWAYTMSKLVALWIFVGAVLIIWFDIKAKRKREVRE